MTSTRKALCSTLSAMVLSVVLAPLSRASAQTPGCDSDAGVNDAGVTIDTTPPVVVGTVLNATAGSNGWYVSNYDVQWMWTDFCSGQTVNSGCNYTSAVSVDGSATYFCSVTSAGGRTDASKVVKRDATPPVITLTGGGNYTADKTVNVQCQASDATSGIATTTCGSVSGAKPAYLFGLGTSTVSASATDVAGNSKTALAIINVSVTPPSLCQLTANLVHASPRYVAANPLGRLEADLALTPACTVLNTYFILPKPAQKLLTLTAYAGTVDLLVLGSWLTSAQGSGLMTLSQSI